MALTNQKNSAIILDLPLKPHVRQYVVNTFGQTIHIPDETNPVSKIVYPHLTGKRLVSSDFIINDTGGWPSVQIQISNRTFHVKRKATIGWTAAKEINSTLEALFDNMAFFIWSKTTGEKREAIRSLLESFDITENQIDLDNYLRKMRRIAKQHQSRTDSHTLASPVFFFKC
jgi:hypothetical protein